MFNATDPDQVNIKGIFLLPSALLTLQCGPVVKASYDPYSDVTNITSIREAVITYTALKELVNVIKPMTTVEEVKAMLLNLEDWGALWHMDDDPVDCGLPETLRAFQSSALKICAEAKVDIFELYPGMPL